MAPCGRGGPGPGLEEDIAEISHKNRTHFAETKTIFNQKQVLHEFTRRSQLCCLDPSDLAFTISAKLPLISPGPVSSVDLPVVGEEHLDPYFPGCALHV